MTDSLPLAQDFPSVSREDWRQLAAAALTRSRGQVSPDDVEQLLAVGTPDGFDLRPLYTAADITSDAANSAPAAGDRRRGASPATGGAWSIRERLWVGGGPEQDLNALSDALANDVASLWLTVVDPVALPDVLAQINLAEVPVVIEGFGAARQCASILLAELPAAGGATGISLGLDPVGWAAATGGGVDIAADLPLAESARDQGIRAFTIDSSIFHEAGASATQELALTTAAGLAVLRELESRGWEPADAAAAIEFRWVVTDEQFPSIAKLRAARLLWSRILRLAEITDTGQRQHAVSSVAMLSARDPWVNLIRNCVAAFAGAVGGAESVTLEPHTLALGTADDFAQRMSRNTQHLLLGESNIGFVADPAGGSYFVEQLTSDLSESAWQQLQSLDEAGGIAKSLQSGVIADELSETWHERSERIATRQEAITGVSEFPDRMRETKSQQPWTRPGGGLPQHRIAESFEGLRDRADNAGDPQVTLLTIGSLANYGAREAFAANLFAAGGISSTTMAADSAADFSVSPVVCLVGADPDYATGVAAAVRRARESGAQQIWLAGKPGDRRETDLAAGLDGYIFQGCDAVAVLEESLSKLGVA